jgi:uncharacterized protein
MGIHAPLTDDELEALDSFLLSEACDDDALAIDEAHGFLTALLLPPATLDIASWQSRIWGQPKFADDAQREHMTGLLQRLHDDIQTTLAARRDFEPLVIEMEEEGELIEAHEGWCFGFMLGVEQNPELWESLPSNEQELALPMAQLALLYSEEDNDMDEDEYLDWVDLIPGAVMGLYSYWHRS